MKEIEDWTMRDYWFWLLTIPGLYRKQLMTLLHYFGSPKDIFYADASELDIFLRHDMKWAGKLMGRQTMQQAQRAEAELSACGGRLIMKEDPEWSAGFRQLADPPYGLFCRGRLPASDIFSIAIVGARSCTRYGRDMACALGAAAARAGMQVISGMALGIDGYAQKACLEAGGFSFALLGCGVDMCYPREHIGLYEKLREQGGVISEFPCGTQPLPSHFPLRNRLISAAADAVVVVEAREKSGSLITADLALDQGRDVYAVPGRSGDVLSGGCNRLLAQGAAGVVLTPEQLMDELTESAVIKGKRLLYDHKNEKTGQIFRKQRRLPENRFIKTPLAPDEELVYSLLDLSPEGLEYLHSASGLDMSRLGIALAGLVTKNLAEEIGQNQYMKR